MSRGKIFVGRKAELEQFKKVLEDPQGQAVLVVGNRGMGKTWLINKMAEFAQNQPNFKCGCVRYEVTPTDSVDSTMALMMDNAFEAAQVVEGSFDSTPRRLQQWKALLNVIKIGDLAMSLRQDPAKNTREQFLERLQLISKQMPENGRAIFIIDPEKYMQEKSASAWRIVVKDLPHKIKLVFAQRTEDELAKNRTFRALDNVIRIPARRLGALKQPDVEELLELRAKSVRKSQRVLCESVEQYKGHPYAIQAALDIIKKTRSVENLPQDPTPDQFAEAQWNEVCEVSNDAVKLLEAYAILQVGVPDDVVQAVSGLETTTQKRLQKRSYLKGLLREEGYGKRIYHAILADYILGQIGKAEKKKYNRRAVQVYRGKLKAVAEKHIAPDALAATRLAEHVLVAEGPKAFVYAFVNECFSSLRLLGLLDTAVSFSGRALDVTQEGTAERAIVLGNLGLIHQTRGELDRAEELHKKSLEINQKLKRQEGVASNYGNLGNVYMGRADLGKAEQMHKSSLQIAQAINLRPVMASEYAALGLVYGMKGNLEEAEEMHSKGLGIYQKLRQSEGIAQQYGNLGLVYMNRGNLNGAEEAVRRSLHISSVGGMTELTAKCHANLCLIYEQLGYIVEAKKYGKKALELFKKIGMKPEIEKVQRLIDGLDKGSDS